MRYCGREFTAEEISWIAEQIATHPKLCRKHLSIQFCERFDWRKADGGLKDMSCRVAHLRMERDGLIHLPPVIRQPFKRSGAIPRTLFGQPRGVVSKPAGEFTLKIDLVHKGTTALWNELIDRYHYLRYTPMAGAQLRYFVSEAGEPVALLGFGASAWRIAPRDEWIGWNDEQRRRNLHLVVNNARFLILPWIQSKNLGSRILALAAKRLPGDWEARYAYRPLLLETFVDTSRFTGGVYRASNWQYMGITKGRGKLEKKKKAILPVKSIWLYPLTRTFRSQLCR